MTPHDYITDKDIIITDPCYLMREESRDAKLHDWDTCSCGERMERLRIFPHWVKRTGVGDGTWKLDGGDGKVLGHISADSGQIGCFNLDEVLAYNPDFLKHKYLDILATIIRGFTGEVKAVHIDGPWGKCLVIRIKGDSTSHGPIDGRTDLGDMTDDDEE